MKLNVRVVHSMHLAGYTQPWELSLTGADVLRVVRELDALGFHKCGLGEHFLVPRAHVADHGDWYFHSATALGCLAGATDHIRLWPTISILPLQNPVVQAKAWSTLDWLSSGRAEVMFGLGWAREEFAALNVPMDKRGRMADEYLAAIIALWTQEYPEFEGEFVQFRDLGFAPRPVQQPLIPIWLAGDAEPVQKRVAKYADGWSPAKIPPEEFPERLDFIKSQPEYDGRPIGIYFNFTLLNKGNHHAIPNDPRETGYRNRQAIIDQINWLAGLGVTETVVTLPPDLRDVEEYLDFQRWVAAEILPHV